jgi:hypothetical protein
MSKYKHIGVTDYEIAYDDIGNVCNRDEVFLATLLEKWFSENSVRIISADHYVGYGVLGYHIFYEDSEKRLK